MSIWFPLHSYSLPTPQQWAAINERVLILYSHGLVMIDQDMKTFFLSMPGIVSISVGDTHWAFQTPDELLWGEIDKIPEPISIPKGHHVIQYSCQGMVTRCGFQRYWHSFHENKQVKIPSGCVQPKIYRNSLYWSEGGVFYRWNAEQGVSHIGHLLEDFEDYLIGPNDWIAVTTSKGAYFIHNGHSYLVDDVVEVLFHSNEEKALLNRFDGVEVLSLEERRFSTQYLPECDELIAFAPLPLILGLDKRYFYTTSVFIQEPEGKGPEFAQASIVMRNEHSILGLAGSMWSWGEDKMPKWIEDIPDFDDGWVGDSGYLILIDEELFYISNQGGIELIDEDFETSDEDALEIEDLGMFFHHSRVEKSPIEIHEIHFDDSFQSWAWSHDGMWVELQ